LHRATRKRDAALHVESGYRFPDQIHGWLDARAGLAALRQRVQGAMGAVPSARGARRPLPVGSARRGERGAAGRTWAAELGRAGLGGCAGFGGVGRRVGLEAGWVSRLGDAAGHDGIGAAVSGGGGGIGGGRGEARAIDGDDGAVGDSVVRGGDASGRGGAGEGAVADVAADVRGCVEAAGRRSFPRADEDSGEAAGVGTGEAGVSADVARGEEGGSEGCR